LGERIAFIYNFSSGEIVEGDCVFAKKETDKCAKFTFKKKMTNPFFVQVESPKCQEYCISFNDGNFGIEFVDKPDEVLFLVEY